MSFAFRSMLCMLTCMVCIPHSVAGPLVFTDGAIYTANDSQPRAEAVIVENSWGTPVDPEKVEAIHKNGVLELHLPKTPEMQPRQIAVQTG